MSNERIGIVVLMAQTCVLVRTDDETWYTYPTVMAAAAACREADPDSRISYRKIDQQVYVVERKAQG